MSPSRLSIYHLLESLSLCFNSKLGLDPPVDGVLELLGPSGVVDMAGHKSLESLSWEHLVIRSWSKRENLTLLAISWRLSASCLGIKSFLASTRLLWNLSTSILSLTSWLISYCLFSPLLLSLLTWKALNMSITPSLLLM